ncbi:dienelactone hydrolase family protein [Rubrolithibacter danxiaensis]|uniref:dienelactone hydrolase family protein n=1 Tax=Rubrolithibacter danxiaensis TaxID=3390805 RepID=UPI003BF8AECE
MINYQFKEEVRIPLDEITLAGDLSTPEHAKGLVVFAHGSGSSRLSSRNKYVAEVLQQGGFSTLLFDLLTVQEDQDYSTRFNIELLTDRLVKVTDWLKQEPKTADQSVGYFGASTGAAATLKAAAALGNIIRAVVSRGGRPDLAGQVLQEVRTPTLLLVGGLDGEVIQLNEHAFSLLRVEKEIRIIPGASHLFEEPGKLEEVASLAAEWFNKHLITVAET